MKLEFSSKFIKIVLTVTSKKLAQALVALFIIYSYTLQYFPTPYNIFP